MADCGIADGGGYVKIEDTGDSYPPSQDAGTIKPINTKCVHQICSGQVVLTLATAVKELLENSIDAGATNVEIKLKEYGSETIEVIDNGCGVEEKNLEGLTLKHHTSKLKDFSGLVAVETFGFRGEALSSLSALSNMAVITQHENAKAGTRLEFDNSGKIISRLPCARQKGTTVVLQNLFHTLPVRHKEFIRNLKKEFSKMVQVLNAYCIVSTGLRISCYNQTGKGNKCLVVSSNGSSTMKENISKVFGPKQLQSLVEFKQVEPTGEICSEFNIVQPENCLNMFGIEGLISRCDHGQGRSSADRQFFFVNKRPCDSVKMSKAVNEVYHMYNRHQYPLVVLSIRMAKESFDVNVTPDKRQIFMENEKLLLAIIKTSLIHLFEPSSSIYSVNILNQPKNGQGYELKSDETRLGKEEDCSYSRNQKNSLTSTLSQLKRSFSSAFDKDDAVCLRYEDWNTKQRRLCGQVDCKQDQGIKKWVVKNKKPVMEDMKCDAWADTNTDKLSSEFCKTEAASETGNIKNEYVYHGSSQESLAEAAGQDEVDETCAASLFDSNLLIDDSENEAGYTGNDRSCDDQKEPSDWSLLTDLSNVCEKTQPNREIILQKFDSLTEKCKKEMMVEFSLDLLKQKLLKKQKAKSNTSSFCRTFRAKISPSENEAAVQELQKEIEKDMFSQMEILGQFNKGFIITLLGQDLFIIDQHAADEKYNFEMLEKNTVIQSQKLIQPQNLELTVSNEMILIDNLEIFKKNGFDFIINESAPPRCRLKLISMPVSNNWNFGKDDIEELIFMLTDLPGVMCRPSRIRQMFASRACRKSIMVGTALSGREMQKVRDVNVPGMLLKFLWHI